MKWIWILGGAAAGYFGVSYLPTSVQTAWTTSNNYVVGTSGPTQIQLAGAAAGAALGWLIGK